MELVYGDFLATELEKDVWLPVFELKLSFRFKVFPALDNSI